MKPEYHALATVVPPSLPLRTSVSTFGCCTASSVISSLFIPHVAVHPISRLGIFFIPAIHPPSRHTKAEEFERCRINIASSSAGVGFEGKKSASSRPCNRLRVVGGCTGVAAGRARSERRDDGDYRRVGDSWVRCLMDELSERR